jgi:hypothetical protein
MGRRQAMKGAIIAGVFLLALPGPVRAQQQKKCRECKVAREKRISRAKLILKCLKCFVVAEQSGRCKGCKKGTAERVCELSGSYPHAPELPQK